MCNAPRYVADHRCTTRSFDHTACTGTEQLYSHVAALAVAKALHAELVVPIAYTLDSSGNYTAYDARSILDVSRMRALWARAGVTLHAVCVVHCFTNACPHKDKQHQPKRRHLPAV